VRVEVQVKGQKMQCAGRNYIYVCVGPIILFLARLCAAARLAKMGLLAQLTAVFAPSKTGRRIWIQGYIIL
jgi:hypothetical protein